MNTCSTGKIYTKRRRKANQFRPPEPKPRPKSRAKTAWVIAFSEDGFEHCLTGRQNWDNQPQLRVDTSGRPMRIVKEFETESYEEARNIYEAQL